MPTAAAEERESAWGGQARLTGCSAPAPQRPAPGQPPASPAAQRPADKRPAPPELSRSRKRAPMQPSTLSTRLAACPGGGGWWVGVGVHYEMLPANTRTFGAGPGEGVWWWCGGGGGVRQLARVKRRGHWHPYRAALGRGAHPWDPGARPRPILEAPLALVQAPDAQRTSPASRCVRGGFHPILLPPRTPCSSRWRTAPSAACSSAQGPTFCRV